jgi:L-asparaginase/Glu-tRNA(Gln) amidotransferase subunit D
LNIVWKTKQKQQQQQQQQDGDIMAKTTTTASSQDESIHNMLDSIAHAILTLDDTVGSSVCDIEEWLSANCKALVTTGYGSGKVSKGLVKDALKKGVEVGTLVKIKNLFKHGYPCYKLKFPQQHMKSATAASRAAAAAPAAEGGGDNNRNGDEENDRPRGSPSTRNSHKAGSRKRRT